MRKLPNDTQEAIKEFLKQLHEPKPADYQKPKTLDDICESLDGIRASLDAINKTLGRIATKGDNIHLY